MQKELDSSRTDVAFATANLLVNFVLSLDVKLPGNAQTFSSSFAFAAYQGIIEYVLLQYSKLAVKDVKSKGEKQRREEEVIGILRKTLFELSEGVQTSSLQISGLLLLAEYACALKGRAEDEQMSTEYYANDARQAKVYQDLLSIYASMHDAGSSPLEKEARACLKLVDNVLMAKYRAKEDDVIKRALKKTGKEEQKGAEGAEVNKHLFEWQKILFDVGISMEDEVRKERKKTKSKFCSLVLKHLGPEQHQIIMGHLNMRLSNLDYMYFAIVSLMSTQKYRKALLLAQVWLYKNHRHDVEIPREQPSRVEKSHDQRAADRREGSP